MKTTDEWLYEYMPKAENALLDEIPDQPEIPFQPSEKFNRRMKRLIRQSRYPRMHSRFMNMTGRVAVVLVLCLVLAGASAKGLKATEPLRMEVTERIWHDDYVEEHYSVTGEGEIKYLTYVPEGYELVSEDETEGDYGVTYEDDLENRIVYCVWIMIDGATVMRDTEFIETEKVVIRERDVLIGYKENGWICCSWEEENALYFLDAEDLGKDELIKMISGIE